MAKTRARAPSEMYALLAGPIDSQAIQRIFASMTAASQNDVTKLHVLFQSGGGGIGEGICLYNVLKTLSIDLTLYNAGSITSSAVIAYLGAKHRKVSRQATFMIHRTQTTTQAVDTRTINAFAQSAALFDKNMEAILREHLTMPAEKWSYFDHNELWFSAEEAVQYGIADEIADFSPPFGAKIFTV